MSMHRGGAAADRQRALKSAFASQSLTDITKQNCGIPPTDGCVILGRHGTTGNTYVTRYHIDHVTERRHATRDVIQEECTPCCAEENKETAKSCLWHFIKSEAFLFSLHMCALAFGVAKEAMDVRRLSEDLEMMHSLIETFVAVLMITIRMIANWHAYKILRDTAYDYEQMSSGNKEMRGQAIKRWRNVVIVIGALMICLSITCFLLFKFLVHLGWTILSNNLAMIVFTIVSGLYTSRIQQTQAKIREDQHKAVLYESMLLIKETFDANINDTKYFRDKLIRFMKASKDTGFLEMPSHISVNDETQRFNTNMLISMEMQSLV